MPDWLAAIILGVIEGLTEFLPISSTGHLLLAGHLLPIQSAFLKDELFTVVIQPGAVLAVVAVFWKRLWFLARTCRQPETRDYLGKLAVAFLITGVGGLMLKKFGFSLPKTVAPVAWATLIGGVLFIVVEAWLNGRTPSPDVTWTIAVAMGVGQLLAAVFPGLSRSGSTILIALAMGLARPQSAEFSFLLGVPTLMAAAAKECLDTFRHPPDYPVAWGLVALGAAVAAVTAFVSVKWMLGYVQHHTFKAFGIYRIVVGGLILLAVTA